MNVSAQKSELSLKRGFTLVELLISVSIILILSGILIPSFSGYLNNQNVLQGVEQLKSDLRTVQNKALTRVGADTPSNLAYWGLKIEADNLNKYKIISTAGNDQNACNGSPIAPISSVDSIKLPGDVVIRNGSGSGSFCVFFNIVNGDVNMVKPAGTSSNQITLGYTNSSTCRGVEINSAGMMKLVNNISCEVN